jgi:hypothetical protein
MDAPVDRSARPLRPSGSMALAGRLRLWAARIGLREAALRRLVLAGGGGEMARRKEEVAGAFLAGFHGALEEAAPASLAGRLAAVAAELRGFAFEGAGLGLTLRDLFAVRRRRFADFAAGAGRQHAYMMHVGAGLALGRSPLPAAMQLARLDPLLRWAAADGYGFYEGLARQPARLGRRLPPRRLSGYARRAFDVGLGRSLWFTRQAEVGPLAAVVASFPQDRQPDFWSGLGIASAYTGWMGAGTLVRLRAAAGRFRPQLCQGAALSAWARRQAGNPTEETDLACRVLCDMPAERVAELAGEAFAGLLGTAEADDPGGPGEQAEPPFEVWRRRVRLRFAETAG